MDNNILNYHKLASESLLRAMNLYLEVIEAKGKININNIDIKGLQANISFLSNNSIDAGINKMRLRSKEMEKQNNEQLLVINIQRVGEQIERSLYYTIELIKLCVQPDNYHSAMLAEHLIATISSFIQRNELRGQIKFRNNLSFDISIVELGIPIDFIFMGLKNEIGKLKSLI